MKPYFEQGGVAIYNADWREVLVDDLMVDHTITDPPFDAYTHSHVRSLKNGGSDIPIDFAPLPDDWSWVAEMLVHTKRWFLAFCAMQSLGHYIGAVPEEAWIRAGIWYRPNGTPQISGDRPAVACDGIAIMHNVITKKRWNSGGKRAFWRSPIEIDANRYHPTQKPTRLMAELITDFTDPGELILDPFMGSGSTIVAAAGLGRRAIGVELQEKYCEVAAWRLEQHGELNPFVAAMQDAKLFV